MNPILAFDTTSEHGSIALWQDDRLLEAAPLHSPDGYAHILFGALESMLKRHNLTWHDLAGFGAAAGPGAFTGVRVGLAAAKGLAEATNKKVVAVSNLQALAWFGTQPLRAPLIDARRGDVFTAIYNARLDPVQPETVLPLEVFLSTRTSLHDLELITALPLQLLHTTPPPELAPAIAALAAPLFACGRAQDPAEIDANYVRRSDAELKWKDPAI